MRACEWVERVVSWGELLAILSVVSLVLVGWEIAKYRAESRR